MTQDTGTAGKIEDTLAERGSQYGSWRLQSAVTQQIKKAFADTPNWEKLPDYMRESLDQIANKFARILSGNYTHLDNWHDTVGYARLAEDCLKQDLANPGSITLPLIIDGDNPPEDWLVEQLVKRGYLVQAPQEEQERTTDDVRPPAFMRDGVRDVLAGGSGSDQE